MYNIHFFEGDHNVMLLNIEGNTRTEVLYTILKGNWEQSGEFIVDEEEYDDIFFDFIQILCNVEKYEGEEAVYRLKLHSEYNLDLTRLLNDSDKNIGAEGIIEIFCNCIKEAWEWNNDKDSEFYITYTIEKE
jgi:hypothetical protein